MSDTKSTPRDVFLHLLSIVTLFISVIAFIALIFQYINHLFPDQLEYFRFTNSFEIIRRSIASLIVAWPIYIWLAVIMGKDFKEEPKKRELKLRKWLLYLTLFVAAITIIIDLITLIFNFLGGDLTSAFLLKTLTVLVVAGFVFGYYLWDLRLSAETRSDRPRIAAWVTSLIVITSIVGGFFITGLPGEQRARRFDEERVSDLQNIQFQIITFYQQKNRLPGNLGELENDITGFTLPQDPETNQEYEYQVLTDLSFEFCATFNKESKTLTAEKPIPRSITGFNTFDQNWDHDSGRWCFTRVIDPDFLDKDSAYLNSEPVRPFFD